MDLGQEDTRWDQWLLKRRVMETDSLLGKRTLLCQEDIRGSKIRPQWPQGPLMGHFHRTHCLPHLFVPGFSSSSLFFTCSPIWEGSPDFLPAGFLHMLLICLLCLLSCHIKTLINRGGSRDWGVKAFAQVHSASQRAERNPARVPIFQPCRVFTWDRIQHSSRAPRAAVCGAF